MSCTLLHTPMHIPIYNAKYVVSIAHIFNLGHFSCLTDFPTVFLSTWKINFLSQSALKVQVQSWKLLHMRRNTCAAWSRSTGQRKLFCVSIYCTGCLVPVLAIRTASNRWLPALNKAVVHGLLHNMGKVRGCFMFQQLFNGCSYHGEGMWLFVFFFVFFCGGGGVYIQFIFHFVLLALNCASLGAL